jgi:phosphohistidine phosphatase
MELFFLRHGKAEPRQTGEDDRERELTDEGRRSLRRGCRRLAQLKLAPDLILTSPLVRARQTAEIAAEELGLADRVRADERLDPHLDAGRLTAILAEHAELASLLLCGHEPSFSEMIGFVIGGGRVACKKGGLARIALSQLDPPAGELIWLLPPRALAP